MSDLNPSSDIPVSWQVDDIDVNASLTIPAGPGPFPAVIMVAGSGPTDRNWNTPLIPGSNGSAALLARVLTRAGYVTLRYDKRATGSHAQENLARMVGKISMQGHREEGAGGVRLLAGRKEVDSRRIFALTNSEGCVHALNYQIQSSGPRFAGLILTSAPARPIGKVAHAQIAAQLAAVPGGEKFLAAYDQAIEDFMAGRPVQVDEGLPEGLRSAILGITNPINLPFSQELWLLDTTTLLAQVKQPVLLVIGKKDVQVSWQDDGAIFDQIVKRQPNIQIVYAENANHVLKYEPKPVAELTTAEVMASYSGENTHLDDAVVEAILSWLKAQMN